MASSSVARPSLWDVALSKLPEKERNELRSGLNSQGSFEINVVTTTVDQLQQQVVSEKWQVKLGHRELNLRPVLDSIVSWVKKFIAIGDIAVQYDPAHAALPWAALRLVLQVLVNDSSRAAAYAKGLERVALYIYDCAIRETLYLNGSHGVQTRLESLIVRLYTTMLEFMYRAKDYFETRSTKRVISSPFKSEDELLAFLHSVEQQVSDIVITSGLIDSQIQSELSTNAKGISESLLQSQAWLRQQIEDTQRIAETLVSNQAETISRFDNIDYRARQSRRLKILRWLSSVPYREHHQKESAEVLENTGSWFLESETFKSWKSSCETAMMWLHGAPGTGKSKLMSLALQSTLEECGNLNPALYFYCSHTAAEPERAIAEDILRCLVKQLSTGNPGHETDQVPDFVAEKYEAAEKIDFASGRLTVADCRSITARFGNLHRKLYIFIDALDELEESMQHDLIETLKDIMVDAPESYVKILISSRDNTSVLPSFSQQKTYDLAVNSGENQDDIDSYVKTQLANLIDQKRIHFRGKTPSQKLQQDIVKTLCAKSQGMFRWVSLQLDYLCTLHNQNDVTSRLGRLPRKLSDSYAEIWAQKTQQYEVEDMTRLSLALSLLLSPKTPTPTVFAGFVFGDDDNDEDCTEIESTTGQILVGEEIGEPQVRKAKWNDSLLEMVTTLCFGLVIFDKTTNSFRFAHTSVQEYIRSRKDGYESLSQIHARIAKRCMSVLVEPQSVVDTVHTFTNRVLWSRKGEDKQLSTMFPTGHWFDRSFECSTIDWISAYWAYFVTNSNEDRQTRCFSNLETRLLDLVDETPWELLDPSVFFSVCRSNHLQFVRRWLNRHPKLALLRLDMGLSLTMTALHYAALSDYPALAECLIGAGADLDAQSSSKFNISPLHMAIQRGSLNTIPLLLQNRDRQRVDHCRSSAEDTKLLKVAIREGRVDVVHALLDHGFSPSGGAESGLTPLATAIEGNFPRILELLTNRGVSVLPYPTANYGPKEIGLQLPLRQAILGDEIDDGECVRVLLKAGADPRVRVRPSDTPLSLSTSLKRKNLVQIFLDFGVDVNDRVDEQGSTPLFRAITTNSDELTKLLLAKGADPNITDASGVTALMGAAKADDDELTKLLLAAGADPNITNLLGATALMGAVEAGNLGAVKKLLAPTTKLTSLNIQSIHSGTALCRAAEKGHQSIVETLLAAGAVIKPQDPGPHCSFMNPSERRDGFAKSALVSALYSRDDATFRTMLIFSAESETRAMEQEVYDKVLRSLDEDGWDSFDALSFSETVPARFGEYRAKGKTDEEAQQSFLTTAKNPFCHFAMTLILNEVERNMLHKDFIDESLNKVGAIIKQRKEKVAENLKDLYISKQELKGE